MKQVRQNLGWLKDYPDVRDFPIGASSKERNPHKREKREALDGLLKKTGILGKKTKKALPRRKDLRRWCSPVKDQGNIGSCTAFAAVGMYEYYQKRAFGQYIDGSELFVYKATRNLLNWTGDTGAYIRTAMGELALFGVPPTSSYPYDTSKYDEEPSAFVYSYGQNFQALIYYRLDPLGTSGNDALSSIKKHICAGFPVMMGFTCYTSLFASETSQTGKIPFPGPTESVIGGHAVLIVGYDDNKEIENPLDNSTTKGALIVKNSWSTDWGDNGYGYIPYEYVKRQAASDFWCMLSAEWVATGNFGL